MRETELNNVTKKCKTATVLTDSMQDIYGLMSTGELASAMHQGKFPEELKAQLCSEVSGIQHMKGGVECRRRPIQTEEIPCAKALWHKCTQETEQR